jgi:hypothetical protein
LYDLAQRLEMNVTDGRTARAAQDAENVQGLLSEILAGLDRVVSDEHR